MTSSPTSRRRPRARSSSSSWRSSRTASTTSRRFSKAMKGLGTDGDCLITILCTLDEEDIFPLQQAYSDRYERSLEQAVISETSGKFKRVLLLAGCDSIDEAYAGVCHSAISGMGTDCKALIRLMVTCPHEVMDKTREAYSRLYGNDLVSDMGGEWAIGGDFKRILCALAKKHPERIVEEPDYAADVATLRDAVEGLGTDEEAIIDVLSNKTFDQIEELKEAYKVEHGELLKERIKAETTGLFESEGFRNTLMGLLTKREEQIAFYLKEAFEGWFANDDWGLISMLVHRTETEMREIRNAYTQVHGSDLIGGYPQKLRRRLRKGARRSRRAPCAHHRPRHQGLHVGLDQLHEQGLAHRPPHPSRRGDEVHPRRV